MFRKFEGINLICLNVGNFRSGAAITLPGIGIVSGKDGLNQPDLLRHEFGHVLQYRKWGFFFYWTRMGPTSLVSAWKANRKKTHEHMHCWTEWSANRLSYHYFNKPGDWDMVNYPINPPLNGNDWLMVYKKNIDAKLRNL